MCAAQAVDISLAQLQQLNAPHEELASECEDQEMCQLQRTIKSIDPTSHGAFTRLNALQQASNLVQCSSFLHVNRQPSTGPAQSSASTAGGGTGAGGGHDQQQPNAGIDPEWVDLTDLLQGGEQPGSEGSEVDLEGTDRRSLDVPYGALDGLFGPQWSSTASVVQDDIGTALSQLEQRGRLQPQGRVQSGNHSCISVAPQVIAWKLTLPIVLNSAVSRWGSHAT